MDLCLVQEGYRLIPLILREPEVRADLMGHLAWERNKLGECSRTGASATLRYSHPNTSSRGRI